MRFSIRDVLWLTVIVALGLAWGLERGRSERLEHKVGVIEIEAAQSRLVIKNLHDDLDKMGQALPPHGLTIAWSREFRPSLQTLSKLAAPK
jgi:hypothetical protein